MPTPAIIAGPNGSGKTTLVRSGVLTPFLDVPTVSINADDFAKVLADGGQPSDEQSLQAARLSDALLDEQIAAGHSVVVETILSSHKYKARLLAARAGGFRVCLSTSPFGPSPSTPPALRYVLPWVGTTYRMSASSPVATAPMRCSRGSHGRPTKSTCSTTTRSLSLPRSRIGDVDAARSRCPGGGACGHGSCPGGERRVSLRAQSAQ